MTKKNNWTFFSNHSHVYFLLAREDDVTIKEVAQNVGITERAVHGIILDLEEGGYIQKEKIGRANRYKIVQNKKLRHPLEAEVKLDDLVNIITEAKLKTL
jgi:predicted ArsR family transcriptional regulator